MTLEAKANVRRSKDKNNLDLDLDLPKYVLQRVITKSLTTHHQRRWFCLFHHFWHLSFVFSFRNVSTGLSCSTPGGSKGRSEAPVKTPASPDSPWQHSQWTSLGNDVGVPIRRGVRSNCPGVFFVDKLFVCLFFGTLKFIVLFSVILFFIFFVRVFLGNNRFFRWLVG